MEKKREGERKKKVRKSVFEGERERVRERGKEN
jgi:hypothetical protein